MLSKDQLKQAHEYYTLNGVKKGSLPKTVKWISQTFGVDLNRHQLSHQFKTNGYYVKPKNGFPEQYWRNPDKFATPEAELAGAMIKLAWLDIGNWLSKKTGYFEYLSACEFLGSETYVVCLGVLMENVGRITIDYDSLLNINSRFAEKYSLSVAPTQSDLASGRAEFNRRARKWLNF